MINQFFNSKLLVYLNLPCLSLLDDVNFHEKAMFDDSVVCWTLKRRDFAS